jgi:hypothetical protein
LSAALPISKITHPVFSKTIINTLYYLKIIK